MNATTLRLVLLVSCAHAMVHVYEMSLPSVEQEIGSAFSVDRMQSGRLGTTWRVPFGVGAMLAGWLADRVGSKRMLIVYLAGCVATSALAWWAPSLGVLFGVMFAMGCFASIYHPAGLAAISRGTTADARGAALGWHGIFGSLGIAAAPLLAGLAISSGFDWRQYYLVLTVPGALLAVALALWMRTDHVPRSAPGGARVPHVEDTPFRLVVFLVLVSTGAISGMVYAAAMHFLKRYLSESQSSVGSLDPTTLASYAASIVLMCGALGQGIAGRIARPARLRGLLVAVMLANVPCLIWMARAEGIDRFWAACLFGLVHFMNQPIYNSLIAHYVPHHRRSTGYGFSNMMCFGIGAIGPAIAGAMPSLGRGFWLLALLAVVATLTAGCLWLLTAGDGRKPAVH